jgi:phenylpyruvate tautomerase PptA (4-oxalocrotonate tautomerase family)
MAAAGPTVSAMPIVEVHLAEGLHTPAQHAQLLRSISVRYAEVLDVPLERVRAYLTLHRPEHWATAGEPGSTRSAPYFTALVLEGEPAGARRRLVEAITDLLVDLLGVDRKLVRGRIIPVHPQDWAIGGIPAGDVRRSGIGAGVAGRH